jgi:urease accessory protein
VTRAFATSPLRLLNPRNHGHAAWIYTATYGGGLVDGDAVHLTVNVDAGATALISTQASTKIYRSPSGTRVDVHARVADGGLLVVAPDPVVCFAGASYRQTQRFELSADAGLILVDWLTSGRRAMGERWAFDACETRLTIAREGRPLVYDALSLRSRDGDLRRRMARFDVVGLVAIVGARLQEHVAGMLSHVSNMPVTKRADLLTGATPVGDDGCIVRLAGAGVETVAHAVREHLRSVPDLLGDDPWARKW